MVRYMSRQADGAESVEATALANSGETSVAPPRNSGTKIPPRRLLGAYYTPDDVAELLTRWAIGNSRDNILDPSFGGCAFMQAAAGVLKGNGCEQPGSNVFGIDIDETCVKYVQQSSELLESNCFFGDFLSIQPQEVRGMPFQAVVGNPPYVRHHWLKDERRKVARRIAEESGQRLPETASLWAYFVLHALAFLKPGGRLAMLVPEAILQAHYAAAVRDALKGHFSKTRLIHLRQRLFKGTDEPVVVVAAEGFGGPGSLDVLSVETPAELNAQLRGLALVGQEVTLPNGRRISNDALVALRRIESLEQIVRFDRLARAHIGLVTGANSHFIRSADALQDLGVPDPARIQILSRTKWLGGLEYKEDDHREVIEAGARGLLVYPTSDLESEAGVQRWIEEGQKAGVNVHHKCAKRRPWYRVDLLPAPDAFVTSTRLGPPLLVLNRGNFRCTNALYAANFNPERDAAPEVIALGFLTTFAALWSEVNGRRYGGGVLKLDLTTLAKLPIPIVSDADTIFDSADAALRRGDESCGRALADEVVLRRGLGISQSEIDAMRGALRSLNRQRVPISEDPESD